MWQPGPTNGGRRRVSGRALVGQVWRRTPSRVGDFSRQILIGHFQTLLQVFDS